MHPTDDVFKASIIPRKESLGVVHRQPREEKFTADRNEMLANIKVSVAGFAAEKLVFGTTTSGVADDFRKAMHFAESMVWKLGMGGNGYIGDFTSINPKEFSNQLKKDLNLAMNQILQTCIKDVETLLTKERVILDRFAHELYTREELEYDDIEAIFKEYGKENPRLKLAPTA
jgi:cell division protease FtsH